GLDPPLSLLYCLDRPELHPFPTRRSSDLGALSAAIALPMIDAGYAGWTYGLVLGAMMVVPSLAILIIDEPERDNVQRVGELFGTDRKSTRLNSSHRTISYAVFCLKKKTL